MPPALLPILGFAAAVTAVLGIYSIMSDLFLRDRARINRRLDEEFRGRQKERAQRSLLFKESSTFTLDAADDAARESGWNERLELLIEQSGLEIPLRRLFLFMVLSGFVVGLVGFVVSRGSYFAWLLFFLGAYVPLGVVQYRRSARLNKLLSQLSDAFDLMARCIRAGQTMSQSMQAVADEFDPPISHEFSLCFEQMNLGLAPEMAMRDLARRTGLLEIQIFVLAMLIQTQTGGNLAELLEKLAAMIRERFRIKGKISALTAEGRLQAAILLALPPLMFGLILVINRGYGSILLEHPMLLVGMAVCEGLGFLWIRRIVNFDF